MALLTTLDGVRNQERHDIIIQMLEVAQRLQNIRDVHMREFCFLKCLLVRLLHLIFRLRLLIVCLDLFLERGQFPLISAEKFAKDCE